MVFVYLTALRVLVNGKKGEYKAWGVDGLVTPSYAPMFSKVEHYPLGSAGKAKLRMLAKLIPEIPYAKDLSGKTVIVCDDDKILWDFVSVKQGLIPDNYGLGLWNTVLYQFDRKGIPLDTIEFKKRGLMTALNKDMAREALIANGFNIIENEPKK